MKRTLTILALIVTFFVSCKKEEATVTPAPTPNPKPQKASKNSMFNNIWTLKETYEDGVQKTSNGTGRYEFTKFGGFRAEFNGVFEDIGSYEFTTKDSNEVKVSVIGGGPAFTWTLVKLEEKVLNTEFTASGKRLKYNYVR